MATPVNPVFQASADDEVTEANEVHQVHTDQSVKFGTPQVKWAIQVCQELSVNQVPPVKWVDKVHAEAQVHEVSPEFQVKTVNKDRKVVKVYKVDQVCKAHPDQLVKKVNPVNEVFRVNEVHLFQVTVLSTLDTPKTLHSQLAQALTNNSGLVTLYFTLKVTNEHTLKI